MLESKISQFSFSNEGQILWQEKLNNPLPGIAVATLEKGEHVLKPIIKVIENELTAKHDQNALKNCLSLWMKTYLGEVLEPLVLLEIPNGVSVKDDAVSQIAAKIYDGLGIVKRSDIEDLIAQLTPETRGDLRAKKIRLGPVLAFIPALNKPAAVRLKALLWSIFNDGDLPVKVPADGIVSVKIEGENLNQQYYRSIGYPLYGGRAVRIDMLDRVINCIYDNASSGKFQARHEMAEWLGCSIEDLYKVIESMGHVKSYDPADNIVEEAAAEEDVKEETTKEESTKDVKPELATFILRKGKAYGKAGAGNRGANPKKKSFDSSKDSNKKQSKNKKAHGKKPQKPRDDRVMSVKAKVNADDSPFAILQQLKK